MRYEPLVLMLLLLQSALPLWAWPTVAEAWTSGDEQSPIEAAYRMFTASDGHCATAPSPARLVAKSPVVLYVGQWFEFSSLHIHAADAAGRTLARVPVFLEVEEVNPPLFSLSNDVIGYGGITPTRTGRFRFRARTICPGTSAEVTFPAVVRPR